MELAEASGGLLRGAQVRGGHHLEQRRAGPVEVDAGLAGVGIMDGLAGVLLEMGAHDAHFDGGAVIEGHLQHAGTDDRRRQLADLIALGQVWVEVVLAVEAAVFADLGADGQAELDRHAYRGLVQHRQHPRQPQVNRAGQAVRRCAEPVGRGGEDLALRGELDVDLQADDRFPTGVQDAPSRAGRASCQLVAR